MRKVIFIILAIAFCATSVVFADQKQDKDAILNELSAYADKDPSILAGAIFSMGDAYLRQNKIDEAITIYEKAENILVNNEDLLNRLGNLYNQKAVYDKAIAVYKKLSELKPDNAWYLQALSNSLNMSGKKDEAADIWKDILAKKAENADIISQAANFYSNINDMEKAVSLAEKAVKLDANNIGYMQNLASFYNRAEKFDKAEEAYKNILNTAKDQWLKDWANGELLNVYQRQNKLDEVAVKLEAELAKNPNDVSLIKLAGELYVRKGENDKALAMYIKAASISADDRNVNNRLVDLYESTGKFNEAASQMEKVVKIAQNEPYLYERLANLYERAGKKEDAKKAWGVVISKVTTDAALYSRYAEALYKLGDLNGAMTQLKKAQDMDSGNLTYTLRSASILIDAGKIEEAKVALGKVIVEAKDDWMKNEAKRRLEEIANMAAKPVAAASNAAKVAAPSYGANVNQEPMVIEIKPGQKEEEGKVLNSEVKKPETKKKRGFSFGR